eukprot:6474028-Amphidinium_carterae.3
MELVHTAWACVQTISFLPLLLYRSLCSTVTVGLDVVVPTCSSSIDKQRSQQDDGEVHKVFVGGLAWEVSVDSVRKDFEECGAVLSTCTCCPLPEVLVNVSVNITMLN